LSERELAIVVVARGIQKATGQILTLDRKLQHLGKATRNASANLQRGVAIAATAAAGAILYATKQASDFEAQLLTINTIARQTTDGLGGTHDGLDAIGDSIREIARSTGKPLEELTAGYYDLLSAGIANADAAGVLRIANELGIGALASTAETVDLLTTAINAYGQKASEAGKDADMFAKAVELGKVKADEIAASFANVAPIAAKQKIGIDEIAAAYAALTAQGVPAAEVPTQMSRAILDLLKPNKALNDLQKKTGKNFMQIARQKGLVVALEEMRKATGGNAQAFKELFGRVEGYKFALETTGDKLKLYQDDLKAVQNSEGTAHQQAEERMKGLSFEWGRFTANVRDAAIEIGSELIPVFADLARDATAWLQGHRPEIKKFAQELGQGVRDAVKWLKSLDWDAIVTALGSAAGFVKDMVGFFLQLPAPIQSFLATGFAANKFTGGVIGDIAGDLAKGLIKGVLGMSAGVVNLSAGVVNGGGVPVSSPAGGPAGAPGVAPLLPAIGFAALLDTAAVGVGTELRKAMHIDFPSQSQDLHSRAISDMATRGVFTPNTKAAVQAAVDQGKKLDELGDSITRSKQATTSALTTNIRTTASKGDAIVAAVHGIKFQANVTTNVSFVDKGDSGMRYSSSTSISSTGPSGVQGPGHGA